MKIVSEITDNAKSRDLTGKKVDYFDLEWYETTRKVLRKTTRNGEEMAFRILKENFRVKHYDVLFEDEKNIILASIIPAPAIIVQPKTMLEMGTICYEIGNQHIPIFIENDEVILPYEDPIFKLLDRSGYKPFKGNRVFENMLKATPDHSVETGGSHKNIDVDALFSKVLPQK